MQKDWQEIGGKWYYFSPYDGFMYRSRVSEINGTMRAFAPSGQMIQAGLGMYILIMMVMFRRLVLCKPKWYCI